MVVIWEVVYCFRIQPESLQVRLNRGSTEGSITDVGLTDDFFIPRGVALALMELLCCILLCDSSIVVSTCAQYLYQKTGLMSCSLFGWKEILCLQSCDWLTCF